MQRLIYDYSNKLRLSENTIVHGEGGGGREKEGERGREGEREGRERERGKERGEKQRSKAAIKGIFIITQSKITNYYTEDISRRFISYTCTLCIYTI